MQFTTTTARIRANFASNRLLQFLAGWYLVFWAWMAIAPLYRHDWWIENILVFFVVALLLATYKIFPLSDLSYLLIAIFMTLHTLGSHYTYSEVPLGFWLRDTFHFSRNHFDRIVHFSFGLLMAYPIREVFLRVAHTKGFWSYYLPLDVVLAFSAMYELMEMVVALIVSPGLGDAWLGTQGDIWDAQKDMGVAFLGAIISMSVTILLRRIIRRRV